MAPKYRNVPTEVDGIRFASRREANRYCELMLLVRAGTISNLELQPRYNLTINGVKVATYVADFRYEESATGAVVVEDAKGVRTPVYRLKKKLMSAIFGVSIREV